MVICLSFNESPPNFYKSYLASVSGSFWVTCWHRLGRFRVRTSVVDKRNFLHIITLSVTETTFGQHLRRDAQSQEIYHAAEQATGRSRR